MTQPNRPAASKDMMQPIPDEIVSRNGITFRPNDPSPPREPVADRRDARDPEQLGDMLLSWREDDEPLSEAYDRLARSPNEIPRGNGKVAPHTPIELTDDAL
jgi:hypothetical protein